MDLIQLGILNCFYSYSWELGLYNNWIKKS